MAVAEGWNFPEKRDNKSWKVIVDVSRGRTLGTAWRGR